MNGETPPAVDTHVTDAGGGPGAGSAAGAPATAELDLREEVPEEESVEVVEGVLPPYTRGWAEIVWPVTRSILALLAAVILIPFLLLFLPDSKVEIAVDWAKTILAPVVGFAGAVVGYYFGTRQDSAAAPTPAPEDEA